MDFPAVFFYCRLQINIDVLYYAVSNGGNVSYSKPKTVPILSGTATRRIRYAVTGGHFLVILLVLTFSVLTDWLDDPEPTITVQFYDPALDNIVDNPSPDPAPDNPVPPTGTQDGGDDAPAPEEPPPVNPEPATVLTPEPVAAIAQPQVTKRTLPKPAINKNLPKPTAQPKVESIKQPKVKNRRLPAKPAVKPTRNSTRQGNKINSNSNSSGRRGPRGSNSEAGHNAPGGQRGNSGYDVQVAMMIKRMWVTPDTYRLGGREPRVLIEVHIAPDGRVTYKRIRTKSGVLAMDQSIANLLDNLYRVKPPFDGKPHTLIFWLKAEANEY
jgi:outer membrane biosynthesis protein TonB